MPTFRAGDAAVFLKPVTAAATGRQIDPEFATMVAKIKTITDSDTVYEVTLEDGEKAATVRQKPRVIRKSNRKEKKARKH